MFQFSKLQLEIEVLDDCCPMGYWGSRLRGIYGHHLLRMFCDHRHIDDCRLCPRFNQCAYPPLFEPVRTSEESSRADKPLKGSTALPPPFVIEPPPRSGPHDVCYPRSTRLSFNALTFGRNCAGVPHIIQAFDQADVFSRRGKGSFRLRAARDLLGGGRPVEADGRVTARNIGDEVSARIGNDELTELRVEFVTPVRLENSKARLIDRRTGLMIISDFFDLIYNLTTRAGSLWQVYGNAWPGEKAFEQWRDELLKASRAVEVIEHNLAMNSEEGETEEIRRWSSHKRREMPTDGFTGSVTFAGRMTRFAPLLRLGEIVHLGNLTAMGLGQYVLTRP